MKLSFTFILAVLFSSFVFTAAAQDDIPRFQKHEVQEGETASSIAKAFNVNLQEFCLLNDFPESVTLTEGQIVLIRQLQPGEMEVEENLPAKKERKIVRTDDAITYEKEAEAKPAAKPASTSSSGSASTTRTTEKPVVKKEATPAPAEKQPVYKESAASKPVFVDEKPGITPASTKAVEVGPGGVKYNVSKDEYHVVAKGQTFFRIALIYGLTIEELKELNGLSSTTVEIGQRLKVRK